MRQPLFEEHRPAAQCHASAPVRPLM
jgi:hypothetical protein